MEKKVVNKIPRKILIIIIAIVVIILVAVSCVMVLLNNKNNPTDPMEGPDDRPVQSEPEEDSTTQALKAEKYYLAKNLERYQNYLEAHADLSMSEIVRDVNINLDKTRYVDDVPADLSKDCLMLVSKYYGLGAYVPDDLVTLNAVYNSGSTPQLRKPAAEAFMKMADAARAEGLTLKNASGYRSYELQSSLYNMYAARDGAAVADTYSSHPGYSEHQAGLATDINWVNTDFQYTPEYDWLQKHAAEYGFIMRYPEGKAELTGFEYEPWHYRYVGPEVAQKVLGDGITYDEYYAYYIEGKE